MVPPAAWRVAVVPGPLGYRNPLQSQIRTPRKVRTPAHRDTLSFNLLILRPLGDTPPPRIDPSGILLPGTPQRSRPSS